MPDATGGNCCAASADLDQMGGRCGAEVARAPPGFQNVFAFSSCYTARASGSRCPVHVARSGSFKTTTRMRWLYEQTSSDA